MDIFLKVAPTILAFCIVIAREISKFLRAIKANKMRVKVEEIAVVVEALYEGCTSAEKLQAFKSICEQKKIEVDKAVKHLETKIIPISKSINSYQIKTKKSDDDRGVTN